MDIEVKTKYYINRKEEKDLVMLIQDNASSEKHIDEIFCDTFMIPRNIRMDFHFSDKDMMKKIVTTMIRPKLEYAKVIWSSYKKKYVLKSESIQRIVRFGRPNRREKHEYYARGNPKRKMEKKNYDV